MRSPHCCATPTSRASRLRAADGVIPQEWVERMKTRLENVDPGTGDCPGFRQGFMRGMLRGWRLQQSNPQ